VTAEKWTAWPHAYGRAEDTPAHLDALLDGDDEAKAAAAVHFQSAIVHQSTLWPASPDAFARLIEILRTTPQPENVLTDCLDALAEAAEYVPPTGTPVPELSDEAREWLAAFADADEDTVEELWEEPDEEVWDWTLARMAALRPSVLALAAELPRTAATTRVETAWTTG
jgi:hypothetical protein